MDNREIEKRIHDAVACEAPDKLNDILAACGLADDERQRLQNERDIQTEKEEQSAQSNEILKFEERTVSTSQQTRKPAHKSLYKTVGSLAAVICLCLVGTMMFRGGSSSDVAAVIGLDVNPSIELSVDDGGKVLDAAAVNEDGNSILDGMDLSGCDMKIAANAIVGSMFQQGYITDTTNSILVSVHAKDSAKGASMQEELSSSLNQYLGSYSVSTAVMGQCITDDDAIEDFAEANGISEGKAYLIQKLLAADSKLTEAGLLKLSTQELILLASEKSSDEQGSVAYGEVNKSQYIGKDVALEIALAKLGVTEPQISGCDIEFECDDGIITYDIEFRAGGVEYEFEIDATTGIIISLSQEYDDCDEDDDWDDDDEWDEDDD